MKQTILNNKVFEFCIKQNFEMIDVIQIKSIKESVKESIESQGLILRLGEEKDVDSINSFQRKMFPEVSTIEDQYTFYRIIKLGYALLIEDELGKIVGVHTSFHYDSSEKVGFCVRSSIDKTRNGDKLGVYLTKYSSIIAYENECKNYHAIIDPKNIASISNSLNYSGYHVQDFKSNLVSVGLPRFEMTIPLEIESLVNTKIDFEKIKIFMEIGTLGLDYLIFYPDEIDRIENNYLNTDYKIIAFVKKDLINERSFYFAIKLARFNSDN
jgi:hypothetical protein